LTAFLSRTRLLAVARKEVVQLRRDRRSLILAFLLPVFMLVMFGYAISWDVRNIRMVVVDQDRTVKSRDFVGAFAASGYFEIVDHLPAARDVLPLFDRGTVRLAVVIPPGFSRRLGDGTSPGAPVQALVDGTDANTATITLAYVRATVQSWSQRVVLEGRTLNPPITSESRVWYNEELVSRNMIVPGLVATIMMIISALLTSLTIAREWERGTMEQLAATPVSRLEVVLGKLIPYIGIGFIDVAITCLLGVFLFQVPFRGDPVLLAVLSFLFLVGAFGLGIWISAVVKSQLLATQMAMLVSYLPAFLLSGFMFSIDAMPAPLRILSHVVPARYFLVVTRGIFLKGVGLEVLLLPALSMILFAVIGLGLAVHAFRKELE
jgi:ABC-2 type transport system permease protein